MERGAKALLYILTGALLLGAAVVALVPAYRQTARALLRGAPEESPIWQSNQAYYTEVQIGGEAEHDHAE
jgi:hypothetical protein